MLIDHVYRGRILNNVHRGDVVEMMVLAALGADWRSVGLAWHPWDLVRGHGENRVRIQVRQMAARQLWGETARQVISFGWKSSPPSYFFRDHPGDAIENEGWFCDVFVIGVHRECDEAITDTLDVAQWQFLVIPTCDLKRGLNTMTLAKALKRWHLTPWASLAAQVDSAVASLEAARGLVTLASSVPPVTGRPA